MSPRLSKFWGLSRYEKGLLFEAASLLLISNLSVKLIPFRQIDSFLRAYGHAHGAKVVEALSDRALDIQVVNLSLSRAARLLPWDSLCLMQSIAAFVMFRRREIPAVMFVGVKFSEDTTLRAHAWVHTDRDGTDENLHSATFSPLVRIG